MQLTFEQLPNAIGLLISKVEKLEELLKVTQRQSRSEIDAPLSIDEAATFLRLSKPTVYSLVSKQEIPYRKKGKRLYFSKQELSSWIGEGRRQTIAEHKQEIDLYLSRIPNKK